MNDSASLRYLNSFLNFERISQQNSSFKWNLDRMRFLLRAARHPEKSFFPILIAGTKGKGSTGFFLESILEASGIRSGFYSSPHLEDPRERIRLLGRIISRKVWVQGMMQVQRLMASHKMPSRLGPLTYFEVMTLLAALVFKREGIQVGIFEVGMGGRLDATNALDHKLAILTPIHLDHEAMLGHTIAKIAYEKAAIIRRREPVVVSAQHPQAMKVIQKRVKQQKAPLWKVSSRAVKGKLGLIGDYQRMNGSAALKAAEILRDQFGFKVTSRGAAKGLQAKRDWPGRFEVFHQGGSDWVLDAAHNPISIEALVRNLKAHYANRPRILIFGTSKDKNSFKMLGILRTFFKEIVLVRAQNSRSAEIPKLMAEARAYFDRIYPFGEISKALEFAKTKLKTGSLAVVTGSFFVIGEARKQVKR